MSNTIASILALIGSIVLLWLRLYQEKRHVKKHFYNRANDLRQHFITMEYQYYTSPLSRKITYTTEIMRLFVWRYGFATLWLWSGLWILSNGVPLLGKSPLIFTIIFVLVAFLVPAILIGLAYITVGIAALITSILAVACYIGYGGYQIGGLLGVVITYFICFVIGWFLINAPGPCWCCNNWYWWYYYYYSDHDR